MRKEAIILAGGLGTRLKSVLTDRPKSMALIGQIPFLSYFLDELVRNNFDKVVIAAGYRHEAIDSYFGSSYNGIKVMYSIEDEPLGTGGAVLNAMGLIESDYCFVLNGDTFFRIDYKGMEEAFNSSKSGMMVALKPLTDFERYGAIVINEERIVSFNEKKYCDKGLINGGTYIVSNKWWRKQAPGTKFSLEKDILEKKVDLEKITYYISDSYFIDIGVPDDYYRAVGELPLLFK